MFYGEGDARNLSALVPHHEHQANNKGELRAVHHVLQALRPGAWLAIVMDSEYVFKGLTEYVWERGGGTVSHSDLWKQVLGLMRPHHK